MSLSPLESQKAKKGIGYSSREIISIPPSYTANTGTSGKNVWVHGSVLEFSPKTAFLDGLMHDLGNHRFLILHDEFTELILTNKNII